MLFFAFKSVVGLGLGVIMFYLVLPYGALAALIVGAFFAAIAMGIIDSLREGSL